MLPKFTYYISTQIESNTLPLSRKGSRLEVSSKHPLSSEAFTSTKLYLKVLLGYLPKVSDPNTIISSSHNSEQLAEVYLRVRVLVE